ncbi:hypothetical protein K9M48_00615 [Candidatus Gracilibacteria bacterium]|nr:hypothetical protein [Candidatus Gracilibacteria bacterium]
MRGFGNYSFRMYEAMSLGRILIYIDTGANLPFIDEINYKDLFIIIPFSKRKYIYKYIDAF